MSLNIIVLQGRLVRDPEMRTTQSGVAVASFTLAADRDFGGRDGGEKQTDFIDCPAWRHTAEFVSKYFSKGRMAVVSGRLQIDNYTDNPGNKRNAAKVIDDNIYFGASKKDGATGSQSDEAASLTPASSGFVPVDVDDGELPF